MMTMARKGLTTIMIIKAETVGGEREHTMATSSYCLDDQQSTHDGDRGGGHDISKASQKAKLDLQKYIVTNSSTYLIYCNVNITVVQFIFFYLSKLAFL